MLKEVQDTVFVATDGTKFIDTGEAYNYDCKVEAQNWLAEREVKSNISLIKSITPGMDNRYTIYKIESKEEYDEFSNYLDDYLNFDIIDSSKEIYVSECGYNKDCQYYTYIQYKHLLGNKCIYIISLDDIIKKHQQICKNIEKIIKKLNKKEKKD